MEILFSGGKCKEKDWNGNEVVARPIGEAPNTLIPNSISFKTIPTEPQQFILNELANAQPQSHLNTITLLPFLSNSQNTLVPISGALLQSGK